MLLDIVLTNGWFTLILIAIGIIIWVVSANVSSQKKSKTELEFKMKDLEFKHQTDMTDMRVNINNYAMKEFEKFKANELIAYQKVIEEQGRETALALLVQWKVVEEARLRKDAVVRSMGVNLGKITKHLIPFSEHFAQFNPQDARFIGSPIDLIVFDGVTDKDDEIDIYFIEVKSGTGNLNARQKKVRDAIANQRVYWKPMNVGSFDWEYDAEQQKGQDEPNAT